MDPLAINTRGRNSPFAAQLKAGFANLRFKGFLERDFLDGFVEQSCPRARVAAFVLLGVFMTLTLLEWLARGQVAVDAEFAARFAIVVPALGFIVLATRSTRLRPHYQQVAIASLTVLGACVAYEAQIAATRGDYSFTAGLILVVVYACLFPGLAFRASASIAGVLLVSYAVLGIAVGAPSEPLVYALVLLTATSAVSLLASYNLEYVLRSSYLETRLLNELAERDGLTGLYNRRMFDDFMSRLWRQSQREEMPLEIILVDIDHFKIFNDLYGHQAGDDCLKKVARCIAAAAKRPFDFAARYGGEEFVLVLYGPPREHSKTVPEQIRRDVMDLAILNEGSSIGDVVTVSLGVAMSAPTSGRSLAGTIQIADEALYEAKRAGRNRVVCKDARVYEVETGNFRVALRSGR